MHKPLAPAVLALACGAVAGAPGPLEEIVITSSRVPMPLREVGTSLSVVDREEILLRGFNNLADVLRYEPAVSISNTGGPGGATSLRIRGESGFRTRVLLDGIDITDTSSPQSAPHFEQLESAGTERVEILRGPQGLMYGADAGGVVAISTDRARPGFGGSASGEFGRYDTSQFAGHLFGGGDTADFALSASQVETDGFNATTTDTVLRDDDGYDNSSVHGRAGWNLGESLRAELVGHRVEGKNDYDTCYTVDDFAATDDCADDFNQRAWRAALTHGGAAFTNQLAYSHNDIDRAFFSEDRRSFSPESALEKVEYLGSWEAGESLTLVYGADLLGESIDDGSFDRDRDQRGYYLEYQGAHAGNLFLTAGVRYDDNDDFGNHTAYRVSAAWLLALETGELKLRGAWGTGFRAPSLYEIAYNDSFAFGPAAATSLREETSEGYDLGIAYYAHRGWSVEAVWFDQKVEDEIYFDLVEFSGYLQGSGESTSRGVEVIGEFPLGELWALSGNYTWNETEDSAGEQRLRAPEHMANVGLAFRPWRGRLTLNLHLRLVRDLADELGQPLDDYALLDLSAGYHLRDDLALYCRVENLTDEDYTEVPSYNTPGAAAYAGLRYSF
jgi:vitamin B12 transporter